MLGIGEDQGKRPRCNFTYTKLPQFINHDQPSAKKAPFSTLLNHHYGHTLQVVMPEDAATRFRQNLDSRSRDVLRYAKVHMKLGEVLRGSFFNKYIKIGNIIMISQGRPGIDQTITLRDGLLRIEVDRPTYERLGLEGKPIVPTPEGQKHNRNRFAIDLDLRAPSMIHGKKGFERLIRACDNVLNDTRTWLFCDVAAASADGKPHSDEVGAPIEQFAPFWRELKPDIGRLNRVHKPIWPWEDMHTEADDLHTLAEEMLEWLSMAAYLSPRLSIDDSIDPILSRYSPPLWTAAKGNSPSAPGQPELTINLVRLQWHGFITAKFARGILLAILKSIGEEWAAISTATLTAEAYTVLVTQDQCMVWEYAN